MSVAAGSPPSPFKGLAPFQDTDLDAQLFCGRDREREVIVANLLASRLTVLYGASGVGKTSLLRAAVTPALRRIPDTAVVFYSSWAGDPRGLGEAIDSAVGIESSGSLTERLAGASQAVGGDVYIILDQFEEYFLYHERDEFADELAAAIREPSLRANFLLGLREDALAKLDAFKGRIPNLFANYLRLDHLDRQGGRAAILGPIERYNELTGETAEVEPGLVEAVLDQVAAGEVDVGRAGRGGVQKDEDRIEAPYLQLVLERLWQVERERGSSVLRLATLRDLGGAESIVRAHLERALGSLEPTEQDVAATMFDHLVTPSGSKIAHRPHDLAQYAEVGESEVMPVLDALGRERIVRAVDGAGGGERYEIFHDVLADGVLAWRARRVIERDREEAHRRQRRLVALAVAALVALGAMTAVAVYALTERSHARSAARLARAHALEATSLFEQATNPTRALADAVAAAQSDPGARAEGVLRQALVANHERRVLRAPGSVSVVAFAPTGGRMLAGDAGGGLRVYSTNGRLERTLAVAGPVTAASFSPNGALVLGAAGREAMLWRAATGERLQTLHLPGAVTSAVVQPRRPRPAHDHRAGRDGLAHGYRPSRCRAREAGCDERRLLAGRPPGRDARCEKAPTFAPAFASSTHEPAGCCTCWRRAGPSWRALRSLRTTASWRRRASRARTSGMPGAAGSRRSPLRQARRGDRRGLQPGRQPARRRGTRRRRSDLGCGEGRPSLLLSGSQQSGPRGRVEPGWALLGGCQRGPDRACVVGQRPPRRPPGGQPRRPRCRCAGNRLEAGRTLAAQRRAQTARRDCGTPSSTKSCAAMGGAAPRRRAGSVVRPRRAPHRVGRR